MLHLKIGFLNSYYVLLHSFQNTSIFNTSFFWSCSVTLSGQNLPGTLHGV